MAIWIIHLLLQLSLKRGELSSLGLQALGFVFEFGLLFRPGFLATNYVEEFAVGHCRQPRAWISRNAIARPGGEGGSKCFLQGLFRQVKRTGQTYQRGNDP